MLEIVIPLSLLFRIFGDGVKYMKNDLHTGEVKSKKSNNEMKSSARELQS